MTTDKDANLGIVIWDRVSELCEILAGAALGISLVPFGYDWLQRVLTGFLIAVLLFLLAVAARLRGGVHEARAEERMRKAMHVVTPERLKTLAEVKVGSDVLEVLETRLKKPKFSGAELTAWLEATLGQQRAQEKLDVVRRYTRVEEKDEEAGSGAEQGAPGMAGTGPAPSAADLRLKPLPSENPAA